MFQDTHTTPKGGKWSCQRELCPLWKPQEQIKYIYDFIYTMLYSNMNYSVFWKWSKYSDNFSSDTSFNSISDNDFIFKSKSFLIKNLYKNTN